LPPLIFIKNPGDIEPSLERGLVGHDWKKRKRKHLSSGVTRQKKEGKAPLARGKGLKEFPLGCPFLHVCQSNPQKTTPRGPLNLESHNHGDKKKVLNPMIGPIKPLLPAHGLARPRHWPRTTMCPCTGGDRKRDRIAPFLPANWKRKTILTEREGHGAKLKEGRQAKW